MGNTPFICCASVSDQRDAPWSLHWCSLLCHLVEFLCSYLSWFQWYCSRFLENQVYAYCSYTESTLILDQPTLNSPAIFKYSFPRAYFMYALWIHIQGFLILWAKRHKYCKVSKLKEFYLTERKKKCCSVRIKFACVSLPLFLPLLRHCWVLIRML